MAIIGQGISLRGMAHNDFNYPFYLADGITKADIGKAVSLDTTGPNKVKLAADDDQIIGRLLTVEDRTVEGVLVGTVERKGGFRFTKTAAAVAVGATVIGAGGGLVKAAATANHAANFVVEVDGNNVIVVF